MGSRHEVVGGLGQQEDNVPYIKKDKRKELDPASHQFAHNAGELNYQLTQIAIDYLSVHGETYQTYNDIVGALESCKLEWYRRMVAPYEEVKIKDNGDVFDGLESQDESAD